VEKEPALDTSEDLSIEIYDDVWVIEGGWLERLVRNINFSDYESRMYFDRMLRNSGHV
jgi:GTP-binding protein